MCRGSAREVTSPSIGPDASNGHRLIARRREFRESPFVVGAELEAPG